MPGIERINIVSDDKYLEKRNLISIQHNNVVNNIYREIFPDLDEDSIITNVSKIDMLGNMDLFQGVDIILQFKDGRKFTVQEKILTFKGESTLTYEQYKRSGKLGGFYYCTANLYFVGYNKSNNIINIDDYILVNNVSLRLDNDINWIVKQNQKEGRKEVFRYINFNDIPEKHIIKRKQIFNQNNEAPSEDLLFSFITL